MFNSMKPTASRGPFGILGSIALTCVAACGTAGPSTAQPPSPNPANATPAATTTAEHPELGEAAAVTEDSLTTAVSTHLQAEATRHGGTLAIHDPQQRRELNLTLATVHREGTRKLRDGRYFVCAEFKGSDGNTYDLDVFMRPDLNGLTSDEIIIHKQNGAPRYTWAQTEGVWTREPVAPR